MIALHFLSQFLIACSFPVGVSGTAPGADFSVFQPNATTENFRFYTDYMRAERIEPNGEKTPLAVMGGEDTITMFMTSDVAKYPIFWTFFYDANDTSKPMPAIKSIHHKTDRVRSYQYTGTCTMTPDPNSN